MSDKKFVLLSFNLFCYWYKNPPSYRLFVDDELLTERTYIWNAPKNAPCEFFTAREKLCKKCDGKYNECKDAQLDGNYLQEVMPLELTPGLHKIQIQSLSPKIRFHIRNLHAKQGPVNIINSTTFEVLECEQ